MFEDEFDFWEDDEPSHWLRRLMFLSIGAVVMYFWTQQKAQQAELEDETVGDGWKRLSTSNETTPPPAAASSSIKVETEPKSEPIVDVTEYQVVDDYVLTSDDIDEDTEIDLALEEEIENGELDDEDDEEEDFDDELEIEGVLSSNEDDDEQLLEPSSHVEPAKWVHALDNGECPVGYPIKARFSTGRFHEPQDRGYNKIIPDCCYETVEDAQADGFTHSRWS